MKKTSFESLHKRDVDTTERPSENASGYFWSLALCLEGRVKYFNDIVIETAE